MAYHFNASKFDLTRENLEKAERGEIERIERFYHEIDKNRTLIGHLMARFKLSKVLNKKFEEITFKRTFEGKPFVDNCDVYFNISHSGDYVVFLASNHMVGIDIEQIKEIKDIRKTFSNIFSSQELEFILENENEERERFYMIWTLKESFIKNVGKGLSFKDLNQINFIIKKDFQYNNISDFFTEKQDFTFDDKLFQDQNWNSSIVLEGFSNYHFYLFQLNGHMISISIKGTQQQI